MKLNLGKNQKAALEFVQNNAGWQSFNDNNRAAREAIAGLEKRGLVEVFAGQYRLKAKPAPAVKPQNAVAAKMIQFRKRAAHAKNKRRRSYWNNQADRLANI